MRSILVVIFALLFSFWLMFHTFQSKGDALYISSKVYSDFGSLLPLIRYSPHGLNWPIQHPLFPGEGIRYHFLFYAPIGYLEKLGLPLSYALNIPSAFGFFSLLFLIYYLARKIFSSTTTAGLSIVLFLFNSSLSFLDYFKKYSFLTLPQLENFVSFRPWNDSQIAAFWTLNIYTNQRHLGFSFAICLLIVFILYQLQNRYLYLTGFLLGSLLFINQAGFLISLIFLLFALLFFSNIRKKVFASLIGFIPWIIFYKAVFTIPDLPPFFLGFLADRPLTALNFLKFWFYNYGLSGFLLIPAFFHTPEKYKPLIIPALVLFITGNLFLLSPDIVNNHKLFNFSFIIFAIFIAGLFARFKRLLFILPLLILGGLTDIFPVINDRLLVFSKNVDQIYFESLPKSSVVLNSTWFYHPASLAGLPVYNGYSYFTWSYGYDQNKREADTIKIYSSQSLTILCNYINNTPISHIETSPNHEKFITISPLFNTLTPVYTNPVTNLKIFKVSDICPNL